MRRPRTWLPASGAGAARGSQVTGALEDLGPGSAETAACSSGAGAAWLAPWVEAGVSGEAVRSRRASLGAGLKGSAE